MCQGIALYNNFQIGKISAYLHQKGAKTCREKELHANIFIQNNSAKMRKEYCSKICPFKDSCANNKTERR